MTSANQNIPAQEKAEPTLDQNLKQLFQLARGAAAQSYSPYSGFKVGAALRLNNGEIVTGTNVENVSYGLTICAERAALVQAVSRFGPSIRVEALAIANLRDIACPPCGACRQFLAEFTGPQAPLVFPLSDGIRVMTFSQVMPLASELKLN
jgi:cytidine deaminase